MDFLDDVDLVRAALVFSVTDRKDPEGARFGREALEFRTGERHDVLLPVELVLDREGRRALDHKVEEVADTVISLARHRLDRGNLGDRDRDDRLVTANSRRGEVDQRFAAVRVLDSADRDAVRRSLGETVRQFNRPIVQLDVRNRVLFRVPVTILADLDFDFEGRRTLETQDEVVQAPTRKFVVHAESALGAVREVCRGEAKDVLLEANQAGLAFAGCSQPLRCDIGVQRVRDAGKSVSVVSRGCREEREIGARLNRLQDVLTSFSIVRALLEGVGSLVRRLACFEGRGQTSIMPILMQTTRTTKDDGNRVDFVGAYAGPDEASIPGELSDRSVEVQRRPRQSLDLPLGFRHVARAVLVADAQELVRSRCRLLDLDVGIRLLSGDTNRGRSPSFDRGRLVRDGPWLQYPERT